MQAYPMIINGKATDSASVIDVINPAVGEVFAQCAQGEPVHVDQAVEAARTAFPAWSQTADEKRQELIHALGAAIESNMPELMSLVSQETGKPLGGLNGVGAGMEVGGAIAWTHFTADLELPVDVIQDDDEARVVVVRKPLGVVASITPWNWPLMIAIWHVMPALRAGNTVVMKPSPLTPVATLRFAQIANEILPPGVFNIVTGDAEVGEAIAHHPGIDKIMFTGSTETGKKIMQGASGNLKRLTLELGGNDAGIVLPDVDVKEVAPKLFGVGFHNNGQTCACLKRLYVHESIYDELCAELKTLAENVVIGDGSDEGVELGPIQNKAQYDIVMDLFNDAKSQGAQILCGGPLDDAKGYFFKPALVTGVSDGDRLVDEEQFGPILPIIKYSDIDEVISRANRNQSGLGGSIWSGNPEAAVPLGQKLECGTAWINDHGAIQPNAPFGGVKQSGFGVEFGNYGLEECCSLQTVKWTK